MPVATYLTTPDFLAQVDQGEAVRRAAHEAEAQRQAFSGSGVDLLPFTPLTKAERRAEAAARAVRWASPEAVLKRALISAANAGSHEAERLYAASCRGDAGWADRASALLTTQAQKAA